MKNKVEPLVLFKSLLQRILGKSLGIFMLVGAHNFCSELRFSNLKFINIYFIFHSIANMPYYKRILVDLSSQSMRG